MKVLVWSAVVIALSTFVVETAFVYCSVAKRLLSMKAVPLDMKCIAYFWYVVGMLADVVFNVTRGSWMFRELPREFMFTSRVKRHVKGKGWRQKKALYWGSIMNEVDPGHV